MIEIRGGGDERESVSGVESETQLHSHKQKRGRNQSVLLKTLADYVCWAPIDNSAYLVFVQLMT